MITIGLSQPVGKRKLLQYSSDYSLRTWFLCSQISVDECDAFFMHVNALSAVLQSAIANFFLRELLSHFLDYRFELWCACSLINLDVLSMFLRKCPLCDFTARHSKFLWRELHFSDYRFETWCKCPAISLDEHVFFVRTNVHSAVFIDPSLQNLVMRITSTYLSSRKTCCARIPISINCKCAWRVQYFLSSSDKVVSRGF